MNLKDIMLREISQIKGKIVHGSTYMRNLKQSNYLKESRLVIAKGWGEGEMGSCHSVGTKFLLYKISKFWRPAVQYCTHS